MVIKNFDGLSFLWLFSGTLNASLECQEPLFGAEPELWGQGQLDKALEIDGENCASGLSSY